MTTSLAHFDCNLALAPNFVENLALDQFGAEPSARGVAKWSAFVAIRSFSAPISTAFERFFNRIKQCQRVAPRYDTLAANFLAFVQCVNMAVATTKRVRPLEKTLQADF